MLSSVKHHNSKSSNETGNSSGSRYDLLEPGFVFRCIMSNFHLLPNAKVAGTFQGWNPDLHFTGIWEEDFNRLKVLLEKYGVFVEAFYFYLPFPRMYSLELQFFNNPQAQAAMKACRTAYEQM